MCLYTWEYIFVSIFCVLLHRGMRHKMCKSTYNRLCSHFWHRWHKSRFSSHSSKKNFTYFHVLYTLRIDIFMNFLMAFWFMMKKRIDEVGRGRFWSVPCIIQSMFQHLSLLESKKLIWRKSRRMKKKNEKKKKNCS